MFHYKYFKSRKCSVTINCVNRKSNIGFSGKFRDLEASSEDFEENEISKMKTYFIL